MFPYRDYYSLIKQAKDMPDFLDQNRPKKVKEIYRALKRDHPEMLAEKKARIAARQGKKGKQHQGPPYKGPLTKEAYKKVIVAKLTKEYGKPKKRREKSAIKRELKEVVKEIPGSAKIAVKGINELAPFGVKVKGSGILRGIEKLSEAKPGKVYAYIGGKRRGWYPKPKELKVPEGHRW